MKWKKKREAKRVQLTVTRTWFYLLFIGQHKYFVIDALFVYLSGLVGKYS